MLSTVLKDAGVTFLRYKDAPTTRDKRLFREVSEWFWSEEENYLYAFETICDYLHLDPAYIRTGLQKVQRVETPMSCRVASGRVVAYRRVEL